MSLQEKQRVFAEYAEPFWRVLGWPIWLPLLVYRNTRARRNEEALPKMIVHSSADDSTASQSS